MTEPGRQDPRAGRAPVDRRPPGRRPARSQRPAAVVYGGAAVGFVAVLAALSWQVAAGADPAIGGGESAAAPAPAKRVVVRRVVRRVVVTEEATATVAARAAAPAPAQAASSSSAPPAPAPAPPAPAPAAPTTRAS